MKQVIAIGSKSGHQPAKSVPSNPGHGALRWKIKTFLTDGANEWNVSQKTMSLICSIPFLVALAGAITALLGKSAYKWFTAEDGFSENLQVVLWSLTLVLSFFIVRRFWKTGDRVIALLYGLLCIGVFFLIGEELSWGQRIFGWSTSEAMQAINKQKETNIHNIHGVGDTFKWIHVLIGAYGTFLPILLSRVKALASHRAKLAPLVPPMTLLPYFVLPLVWRLYVNLIEPPARFTFVIAEYSEVIELILAIGFVFFMIFQLKQPVDAKKRGAPTPRASAIYR